MAGLGKSGHRVRNIEVGDYIQEKGDFLVCWRNAVIKSQKIGWDRSIDLVYVLQYVPKLRMQSALDCIELDFCLMIKFVMTKHEQSSHVHMGLASAQLQKANEMMQQININYLARSPQ